MNYGLTNSPQKIKIKGDCPLLLSLNYSMFHFISGYSVRMVLNSIVEEIL